MEYCNGSTIYDRMGNKIACVSGSGYDYQKNRANVTDYAIFNQRQSPYGVFRYGVINVDNLKVVVPPNFNEVDYIILEAPSNKHYREKGSYEIYIKACIECLNAEGIYNKYWGLFKDAEYILPCFYKSIELLRVKDKCFILLESKDGLKGVFYNGEFVAQCNYVTIDIEGYYLRMKTTNGLFDVLYIGKNRSDTPVVFENYSSFKLASVNLNFQKTAYTCEDAIIVEKSNKYGLICRDIIITECTYDEISVINANSNMYMLNSEVLTGNPIWFMLRRGKLKGVLGCDGVVPFQTAICYSDVNVLDYKTYESGYRGDESRYMVGMFDDKLYSLYDDNKRICFNPDMMFVGFLSEKVMAFYNEDTFELKLYDYRGDECTYKVFHSDGLLYDNFNEDLSKGTICLDAVAFISYPWLSYNNYKTERFVFSFEEEKIVFNPFYQDENEEGLDDKEYITDYEDDTDYERDTYYALGGDDYDTFRERGGSIDDMMDGMGF